MTNILLADDHHVVRRGLKALLEGERDFQVIGEAADGIEALALVDQLEPDVLVLDLMMPGLNGLEVARRVRKSTDTTRVVILSMYSDEPRVLAALRAGAQAYILKESTANELVQAIREVAKGGRYLSRQLSERAFDAYVRQGEVSTEDPFEGLTDREREILHLAAEGRSNSDIATRLVISPRTVETHRANMMRKLGLKSQTDLILFAVRRGILPTGSE
jgi:DNA-binding NarL/FixJ family response regulator